MKKTFRIIFMAAMMLVSASVFAASKKSIVCTTYPEYDWVMNILGKNASNFDVTLLQNKGTDLHSYQPTVQDLAKISACDLFVYVGGESDEWVEDALKNARNKNMTVINMMEVLGDAVREEEIVEGMQESEEHEHGHDHHHEAEAHNHSAEIHADDIKDRSLAEFNGEWQSLYPVLMAGSLEEYVEHQAEEKGKSEEDMKAEIAAKWNCGVKTVTVKGNKITLTYDDGKTVSGKYSYAGYAVKKNDEGKITNVRYKFESKDKKVPRYVCSTITAMHQLIKLLIFIFILATTVLMNSWTQKSFLILLIQSFLHMNVKTFFWATTTTSMLKVITIMTAKNLNMMSMSGSL